MTYRKPPTDIDYGSTHVLLESTEWLLARQPCEVCGLEWLDLSMHAGHERPLTTVANQVCRPRDPWVWNDMVREREDIMGFQYRKLNPGESDVYKYELVGEITVRLTGRFPRVDHEWVDVHPMTGITFRRLYQWDGASGPTIDTPDSMLPSLVHDGLYQLMRERLLPLSYRKAADREFLRLLKECGMPRWRRTYWYWAVRIAGKSRITADWSDG